ncbi:MAG: helix-turn-helix domain-containing protein [Heliobacteriaceae bacterium]|jgi:transcriptional regulator with XRE-family HTH domain|nr:helix-turn-helix domain-containing protein [Heliobacteriaceae bacterium]
MMDLKKEFGIKLKEYRKVRNLTQEEFAFQIGIKPQTLSGVENGYSFPSYSVLVKVFEVLDVPPAYLFTFTGDIEKLDDEKLQIRLVELFKRLTPKKRKLAFALFKFVEGYRL